MKLMVGTRTSKLALAQTKLAIEELHKDMPEYEFEIVPISTKGDQDRVTPLHLMKENGLFVKAIEGALLDHEIDLAIHSLKDVSSHMDPQLGLLSLHLYEDRRDCLLTKDHQTLQTLPKGAKVATGSLRRQACIHYYRPDIRFENIRGNIESRIRTFKQDPQLDALVLATAGLKRLGLQDEIDEILDPRIVIPACGQGTIAIQIREADRKIFHDKKIGSLCEREVKIERDFLTLWGGGCRYPIGCHACIDQEQIQLQACVGETVENCRFVSMVLPLDQEEMAAQILFQKIKEVK